MDWIHEQGADIQSARKDIEQWAAWHNASVTGIDKSHARKMRERAKAEGKDVAF